MKMFNRCLGYGREEGRKEGEEEERKKEKERRKGKEEGKKGQATYSMELENSRLESFL